MKSEYTMKQYIISAALYVAATALAVGCTNNPLDEENIQPQQKLVKVTLSTERPAEVGDTRTQLDGTAVAWEATDEISVFIGESGTNNKFTVYEGQIDGNKVTFTGEVTEAEAEALSAGTANVLVAYPYSSKIKLNSATELIGVAVPAVQELKAGTFASGSNISVGTLDADTKLQFKNVGGLIRLDVTGSGQTIKMIEITSPDNTLPAGDGTIDATVAAPAMSDLHHGSTTIALTSEEGVTVSGTTSFFAAALPTAVANGVYTVTFTLADGTWYQTNITAKGTLNRAKIIKLTANLTSAAFQTPVAFTESYYCYGTANCVLVTDVAKPVSFSVAPHPADSNLIIDETTRTTNPAPAEVVCLWKENNSDYSAGFTHVEAVLAGSTVTVTNMDGVGNAVLGIRDAEGNILWSFHVWVPEIDPTATLSYSGGYKMMPLALGAVNTTDANKASGEFYQWGRKDPLGRYLAQYKRYCPADAIEGLSVPADNLKNGTKQSITWTIQNPTTFITSSGTWMANPVIIDLWGSQKTIYDPCPKGYKVAPKEAYYIFTNGTGSKITTATCNAESTDVTAESGLHFYYEAIGSGLTDLYAASGRRNNSSSVAGGGGTTGCFHSSEADSSSAYALYFDATNINSLNKPVKAMGYNVRCVKE